MSKIEKLEQELATLRQENGMLRNFVDASKDALFCIEFTEPVDLTAPESEIIRQAFENESVWRMCNTAMARLYKLPEELDFNAQNVHFVFVHNPENEEFVRTLIGAEFNIDGVISLDEDYYGREVYMENDIRATIKDGMLHQMIGAVRNVSQQRVREQALTDRLNAMSNVLSAIPDPILVVDMDGVLQAANPAVEWEFGWRLDDVLGQPVSTVITFPESFSLSGDFPTLGSEGPRLSVEMLHSNGGGSQCKAHVSSFGDMGGERRIVITLRSEKVLHDMMSTKRTTANVPDNVRSVGRR